MRVILAGYNLDAEIIAEAQQRGLDPDRLTPETLSAAYARISRNPAPVDELRREARQEVAKARASNERIVFGLGHASVAEHAVFNFDLLGVSRLAIEEVEHFRLCSYTEKSQRYIRLQDEVILPRELEQLGFAPRFVELTALQQRTYHLLYDRLREYFFDQHPGLAAQKTQHPTLDGWAKEDARYVTCLAVEGQLGLTANARNLELMIRRLAAHPLQEVQQLAAALRGPAQTVAPSLIRYTNPGPADAPLCPELQQLAAALATATPSPLEENAPFSEENVRLLQAPPDGDLLIIAALLHGADLGSYPICLAHATAMTEQQRRQVIQAALRPLAVHHAPPRAFEMATVQFELAVSASCFAQLKRHRMASLTTQAYDPRLGTTMPESVAAVGLTAEFQQVMAASEQLYQEVRPLHAQAAPYVLTQAHRRRVLLQISARELYHFSRLRQDQHAQWDIRRLADRMLSLARPHLPLTLALACGKDRFAQTRESVFAEKPR
jgi:flavin-dependent thymidylate synthase